ncbi:MULTISPECIES: hypothetical protein [unclassified Adlercreutzia]|uniref:hypothetical protein n=1 Tax=unclassified Adlercreutzia TaxID=2636013 RepID=UPI0013EB0152|nr:MULTISPECIES: hypothetical protein [unclassified Adlercreutzia]
MVGTKLAPPAGSGAKLTTRLLAALMALMLCAGLMPAVPAWATEAPEGALLESTGSVTLVIAYDVDGDRSSELMLNKSYSFYSGKATLGDLLAAAKSAGDLLGYEFSGGYLSSVTFADGTTVRNAGDFSKYWASYVNGGYASGDEASEGGVLKSGTSYQFEWTGYPSPIAAPVDWKATPEPELSSTICGLVPGARLAIAYDSDGDGKSEIVVNKVYGFRTGATLGDLLAAAKSAGDLLGYELSGGYLCSVTFADGTTVRNAGDFSKYWASYVNGGYASGDEASEGGVLKSGTSYQFEWTGYPSPIAAPVDWKNAPNPSIGTAICGDASSGSGSEPGQPQDGPVAAVNKYDAAKASTLMQNLAARFSKGGSDAVIYPIAVHAAIALNSLGLGKNIDSKAIFEGFASYEEKYGCAPGAGQYGKYIISLNAAGVDCTAVADGDKVRNLVQEMEELTGKSEPNIYEAVFILPVYGNAGYAQTKGLGEEALVSLILASQDEGGLFGSGQYYDSQTTAQAILALLPYQDDPAVASAIEKAEKALLSMQNADGGFSLDKSPSNSSNFDATANVIAALVALGHDPAESGSLITDNGSSPMGFLLSLANDNLSGFGGPTIYDEVASSAVALLALAANDGYQKADGAFDVYQVKAVSQEPAADPAAGQTTQGSQTPSGSALAPTGDDAGASAGVAAAALLGALACAVAARRKASRAARDVVVR